MRLPPHPNPVSFDALVLDRDEADGHPEADKVVGFTAHFVGGGTLHKNPNRVFMLRYLEQLIEVVDMLNLRLGIVHGDICPWNLLIDHSTDCLKVFDFSNASKLGWEGDESEYGSLTFRYDEECNDVKFVVHTLYETITREFCFRREFYPHELNAGKLPRKRQWKQHPDTQLDHPVADYLRVLKDWVKRRKTVDQRIKHFTDALQHLDWLLVPEVPEHDVRGYDVDMTPGQLRFTLEYVGAKYVHWARPPTSRLPLPNGQCLLATGEIVKDGDSAEDDE